MTVLRALCSTGAFSHDPDLTTIDIVTSGMRRLPGTPFEVIFYHSWYENAQQIARQITAVDASTPVVHAEKSIGPLLVDAGHREQVFDLFEINCRFARAIGAGILVLHLWGLPDSDTRIDDQLATLPRLLDIADRYQLTVSVETLLCRSSTPIDVAARLLSTDARVKITADTGFLAMHDQLRAVISDDRLWTSTGINHVHLKDYADPSVGWEQAGYLHPGQGSLALTDFVAGLKTRHYSGSITLEAPARDEHGVPDVDRIQRSLEWIETALND